MLLRLMLAVCIWMMAVMPCAWAVEENPSENKLWAENPGNTFSSMEYHELRQLYPERYSLIIETDEWFEEDTYYIRYTFTNPTDNVFDELVTHTYVDLHASNGTDDSNRITKHDPFGEWHLYIPPHATTTHTVTLPKEPAYSHFIHQETIFQLASGNRILYYWNPVSDMFPNNTKPPAKIDFHFEPTSLNSGTLAITVTNQTSKPLSTMRNIILYATKPEDILYSPKFSTSVSDSFSLNLQPNESKTIHLSNIPLTPTLNFPPNYIYPYLEIDHIRYGYYPIDKSFKHSPRIISYSPIAYHHDPFPFDISITGNMEIIDEDVFYYITLKNMSDHIQKMDSLRSSTDYKTQAHTLRSFFWRLSLKEPIILLPGKSKHYMFSLPCMTETPAQMLNSSTIFTSDVLFNNSSYYPILSNKRLHPLKKALYQPLYGSIMTFRYNYWHPYILY